MARLDELKKFRTDELNETAHQFIVQKVWSRNENHDEWLIWKQLGVIFDMLRIIYVGVKDIPGFTITPVRQSRVTAFAAKATKTKDIITASNAAAAALNSLTTEQEVLDFNYDSFFAGL